MIDDLALCQTSKTGVTYGGSDCGKPLCHVAGSNRLGNFCEHRFGSRTIRVDMCRRMGKAWIKSATREEPAIQHSRCEQSPQGGRMFVIKT